MDQNRASDVSTETTIAPGTLVVSAGMESAGSGWLFNMTNELLQAAGSPDTRETRRRYQLEDVLLHDNANAGDIDQSVWDRLAPVVAGGTSLVVKSHRRPSPLVSQLIGEGRLKATYIYRDPRDVVVSAYQRGQKRRERGRTGSFARLRSIDVALVWMRWRQLPVANAWRDQPGVCLVRYEDLQSDPVDTLEAVAQYLELGLERQHVEQIAEAYVGDRARSKVGTHYRGGSKRRDQLTAGQLKRANRLFRESLRWMGYPLD